MKFSQLLNRKDSIKEKTQTAYVRASKLFDERWYVSHYQDVFKKLKDPARHYYLRGWKESRNPSENFDTTAYLRQYPECGICPIVFDHNRNDYADLAVCVIVKDEAPYMKEWLDYHLMVGVKRFYIYDNESFDNLKQILLPYIRQGVVIYKYYPGETMQLPCYKEFLSEYGNKNEWVAFIDADEFIIPMENATIPEFLADYKEYPGVGVNWVAYDSNGYKEMPKGGVLENYTRVHYDENLVPFHLIKSIVRPSEVSKVVNPHFFLFKGDKFAVNENKEEIGGELAERAFISPFSANKIRINHYYCKSQAEAEAKVLRGSSDRDIGRRKNISANELNFPDYKYDYTAYKFVLQLNPEKTKAEEIKMAWLRLKNAWIKLKHEMKPNQLYDYVDEKWYFEQYPDAKKSGISAASHYVNIGWRKGYNPSKKFDTNFYLSKYKDVAKVHICPLLHYLNSGKNEGRLAFEGDVAKASVASKKVVKKTTCSLLSRICYHLKKDEEYNKNWQNKNYFDEDWYLKQYSDVASYKDGAKAHYRKEGWINGYNPSAKFDTNKYLQQYPECKICPIDFEYNRNRYVDLAICAIMKNEAPYVKEWLEYHQMVGVKRFYIYDNESEDNLCQELLPYIREGIVVYKNYPGEAMQMPAYNEFIKEYGDKNEWVAFIDADEFIIPMEKNSIPEFLADYKEYPGVGINWVSYDSNGHRTKPAGGVLENYTRVHYDENLVPFHQIKSIVQPCKVDKIINPHFALFKDEVLAVNENKEEIGGSLEERAYISPFSANKIRINHYFCKSEEEYIAKIERGRAPTKRNVKRVYSQGQVFFDDYKYDYAAYKFVCRLKPEIAQDEEIKYAWQKLKNVWFKLKHEIKPSQLYDYIDEEWYFKQYPDAKESGLSAATHYMNIGWRKGYNPSEKFDTNFYLKKYKDVVRMHVCPLLHYINSGKKEGRLAYGGDVAKASVASKKVVKKTTGSLFSRICCYFKEEEKYNENWQDKNYFNEDWYLAQYPEANGYKGGAKAHYRKEGWQKGYNPSEKFNTEEYLKQYPECKICPIDFEYNRNGCVDLSIVAIMKNEAPYVKEWIDYSRLVGVKRFYIYDNESTDNLKEILTPYIEQGVVIYKYWDIPFNDGAQLKAYNECIEKNRDKTRWLALIDADEFIVPTEKDSIPEFLEDYKEYPGVILYWVCYDTNGHIEKPKGGIMENYTKCHYNHIDNGDTRTKAIVNMSQVSRAEIHYSHYYNERSGNNGVDSSYRPIIGNPPYNTPSYNRIRINHYKCRSYSEFKQKILKPRPKDLLQDVKEAYDYSDYTYDYTIYKYVRKMPGKNQLKELLRYNYLKIKRAIIWLQHQNGGDIHNYIDEKWYLKQYPDYESEAPNAYEHYLNIGWKKGYDPSLKFSTLAYYTMYQDIAHSGQNPLIHYIDKGKREGRLNFLDYFDRTWYLQQYPEVKELNIDAVEHFLTIGWKEGKNPNKDFDCKFYIQTYKDIERAGINPYIHYITRGKNEGRLPSAIKASSRDIKDIFECIFCHKFNCQPKNVQKAVNKNDTNYLLLDNPELFDKKWYARKYLKGQKNVDPIEHFLKDGWKKGYNPCRNFDTQFYLNKYPDIARAGINPYIHYLRNGKKEGRLPKANRVSLWKRMFMNKKLLGKSEEYIAIYKSGLFDEKWYLTQHPEIKKQGVDALSHYLDEGWKLGYNPSEKFDTNFYIQNCPDVEQSKMNPLRHYVISGKNEGRKCLPPYRKIVNNGATPEEDKNPKISVIVASFNYEQYIGETLDSLVKQTYKNFEVIVVDDGSKDNSVNVIKKYVKKYHNVFLHRHHGGANRGLFETIKLGLEKSSGKYIAFCESDDYWLPNNLEEKVKVINEYNSPKIIYNNVKLFGPGEKKQEEYIANLSLVGEGLYDVDPINQTYNIIPTFSCVMIDKQALLECDFNSYIPAWTDWWLYRQIFAKYPMYHVNKALTMWRIHDSYNSEKKAMARMEHFDEFIFYNNELVVDRNKKLIDNVYEDNHVDLLKKSDLFDEKYYVKHYPEVKKFKLPPVYHYLKVGWKLGYNPSEKFNTNAYLNLYTDVIKINPLVHYMLFGKKENRNPIACNQKPVFYYGNGKNNGKNILLVSNLLNHTGAPMLLLNIGELFIDKGYKVTILSPFDGDLRDEFLKIGADVIIDARIYGNDGHEEYLKKYNFSYCVCNTFINSVIYNMVSKFIPSVLWCHENINSVLSYTITERLEKINEIYVPSLLTKSYMDKFNSNVKILPYPIKDLVNNISSGTDKEVLKIAVCATLSDRKGQDIFVEAIKNIDENLRKNAEFILLGDEGTAGYESKIRKMAQNIANVKFLPALKNLQEYHKFLDGIDILCCPSREDPSPLVVIDAFMHSVPVIMSDHVGQCSLIKNGENGFVFASENVTQLKDIIEKVIKIDNLEDLRKSSRAIFEDNYDQNKFFKNFSEIMEAKCAV